MDCPVCDNVRMREVDRDGVTIDICPQCKGVWLDRGELDKLLGGVKEIRDDFNRWYSEKETYEDRRSSAHRHDPYYHKRKKKNFLDRISDIFD